MGKPRWRIPKQPRANREIKKPKGTKLTEGEKLAHDIDLRPDEQAILPGRDFLGDLQARYRGNAVDSEEVINSYMRKRLGRSPEGY